jgi:hypothetical protein
MNNPMDRKEDRDILRKVGFAESEMNQLSKLRMMISEQEKREALVLHRRLEFARWLVVQGKITEQIA